MGGGQTQFYEMYRAGLSYVIHGGLKGCYESVELTIH